jgi:hypothetical protein
MATWLALGGFLALLGGALYLIMGMPRVFRGHHTDGNTDLAGGSPSIGDSGHHGGHSGDSGGGDGGSH